MTEASSAVAPDGRAVANTLLKMAKAKGLDLTIMQLLKVLFFAHAISLVVRGEPLVADRAQAWPYGPVFPRIYRAFSRWGRRPIAEPATDKATGAEFAATLPADAIAMIEVALERFGRMSAFRLSDLTHAPGSPWETIFRTLGPYAEIPDELIRQHYQASVPTPVRAA